MLSVGLPRLWLCAPPARKDASCAGHHIYARVKPVHVLFIPWYAPNSVCIRIFGCLESVCNMIGWPAHMLPHKQSNHSTTSHYRYLPPYRRYHRRRRRRHHHHHHRIKEIRRACNFSIRAHQQAAPTSIRACLLHWFHSFKRRKFRNHAHQLIIYRCMAY